jgi:tRNA (guanine37-N1)-methyltransferase
MIIDIITIFPDMFTGPMTESIIKRAQSQNIVSIRIHDLRQWTDLPHHTTDDRPYGGGPGMVMMVEPIHKAIQSLSKNSSLIKGGRAVSQESYNQKIILTAASGQTFTQAKAREYSQLQHLIIIAGHYEGVDQRVEDHLVDESISIGDYVLTGGELPAMVITDAITRLLPGVVGDPQSIIDESHSQAGYKEYPHYTRPENYNGWEVPKVLLSGNHAAIESWRKQNKKS